MEPPAFIFEPAGISSGSSFFWKIILNYITTLIKYDYTWVYTVSRANQIIDICTIQTAY